MAEHLAHNPKIKASNPAAGGGRENMAEKIMAIVLPQYLSTRILGS